MKTQKISKHISKRFTTPVWIKHKEPREVNMFVDLLLLEAISAAISIVMFSTQRDFISPQKKDTSLGSFLDLVWKLSCKGNFAIYLLFLAHMIDVILNSFSTLLSEKPFAVQG
ncbi:Vps51/Vps67 family (components of vesicular transport) protein [Zea mays]|uniref:Vps51/Vps67 family (Components of vesicular transport) protein n=1 Tax=Zea mays TaxID=4577 RepID=A0A1D6FBD4_MAIZE|nr:Vps51/Vps67 family (components of vesicular transport) protein [Zea mays]